MSREKATDEAPLCLPPKPLGRLRQPLPPGAIDCHFHVFRAGAPLSSPRNYTPQMQTLEDWTGFAAAAGMARGVVVQPSVYGFDNGVLLEALEAMPGRLRGVVVIAPDTPEAELERMHELGVRGVRVNTRNTGGLRFDSASALARRIAPFGWSLQFQVNPEQLRDLAGIVRDLPLPVVVDHLGFIPFGRPQTGAYLLDLHALLANGDCHVKISAPYRLDGSAGFAAFGEAVADLARAHPDRLLWGSDWPHTELWDNVPDDAELIERTNDWLGDALVRAKAFAENPQRLFFDR